MKNQPLIIILLTLAARGISCDWGADDQKLDCFRWNTDGSGASGAIMVLIY
ncbi:MAG: hypothetical protein JW726_07620 [Anaerolineales bacterium]|nr:hypothetical protein [Anaerolineales bacterium]